MDFIFTILAGFLNGTIDRINSMIENHERKINLSKIAIMRATYLATFLITFLLGNATAMSAIIYKDALGTLGLLFPISSCIVLYGISLISINNIIFYSNERKYYKRELEEKITKENK